MSSNRPKRNTRKRQVQSGSQVEALECRRLLSATATSTLANVSVAPSATATSVDLSGYFSDPSIASGDTTVLVKTTNGDIPLELFNGVTPNTVTNFLQYVNGGLYNGVIFHRTVSSFIDQTGGFNTSGQAITNLGAVNNEFHLSNTAGTIAMAKVSGNPNSASNQWFINVGNNASILDGQNGGFTVFGKVLYNGMTVATTINSLPTIDGSALNSQFGPQNGANVFPVQSASAGVAASNLVVMNSVAAVQPLSFSVSSDNPTLVSPTIESDGKTLSLTYAADQKGWAHIIVTATDLGGGTASETFRVNVGTTGDVTSVVAGSGGGKAVQVHQADGTLVTISLKGPGSATVQVSGDGFSKATEKNGTILVSGTNDALATLRTSGTTHSSTLNITTQRGKIVSLSQLITNSDLRSINGKNVILTGNLDATGSIKSITLQAAQNGTISIGTVSQPLTLKISGAASAESIHSAASIQNMSVSSWDGVSNTTSSIDAPSIGTVIVRKDLANVAIRQSGSGILLKNLLVGGELNGVILDSNGTINSITVGSVNGSQIFAGVGTLPPSQPLPASASDFSASADIKSLRVKASFSNSDIAAQSLGHLSLGKVQTSNGGASFGIAAHTIATVSGFDQNTSSKISLKNLTSSAASTSFEDFVIRLL